MHYPELEKYQAQFPELSQYFSSLEEYMSAVEARAPDNRLITPIQLAQALGVNEVIALALLRLCDKAGLVAPRYFAWCTESEVFLKEFVSLDDIPPTIFCDFHGRQHNADEYYVELVFRFERRSVQGRQSELRVQTGSLMSTA